MIYSKIATTKSRTRTWHQFEHIELLPQLRKNRNFKLGLSWAKLSPIEMKIDLIKVWNLIKLIWFALINKYDRHLSNWWFSSKWFLSSSWETKRIAWLSSRLLNNQLQQDKEFDQGDELHHQHNWILSW